MPLDQADQERLTRAEGDPNKVVVKAPSERHKLGVTTVVCLIVNRSIGSLIFVSPAIVLKSSNSVGISLVLWSLGAIVSILGLLVWLELGLSIPRFEVGGNEVSVPRSGGEKNYLEYIHGNKFLTTCLFAVMFLIFGNSAGNSIAFGSYVMVAAGDPQNTQAIRGLAVTAFTVPCLLHLSWRRGGLLLNNVLALMKVALLLMIIGLGFAALGGASFGHSPIHTQNFDAKKSFSDPGSDIASYADSFLYIIMSFNGFKQPFYVLSEVSQLRKTFAKATIGAVGLVTLLYMLTNVAYLCAVSKDQQLNSQADMATLFFKDIFENDTATRVMAGIIALSIFGSIVVLTFTASRVKQEIAKEGILPFSRFFAQARATPIAKILAWWRSRGNSGPALQMDELEHSPAAALLLHWIFSAILVGATSGLSPDIAYKVLISLYSYVLVVLVGFLVSGGLLYLKWSKGSKWTNQVSFRPWGGPAAAIIYSLVCAFLIVAAFVKSAGSSDQTSGTQWYIVPTVGLSSLLLGVIYFSGLHCVMWYKGRQLVVERWPIIVKDGDEYIQTKEIVDFEWEVHQEKPKEHKMK